MNAWQRIRNTVSPPIHQPLGKRLARFHALTLWIAAEARHPTTPSGLLEDLEAGPRDLTELLERQRRCVVQEWIPQWERGEAAVVDRARSLKRVLNVLRNSMDDKEGSEYVACINTMQPLLFILGGGGGGEDQEESFSLVPINDATSIYAGAVVYRVATDSMYPLEWFWSAPEDGHLQSLVAALCFPEPCESTWRVPLPRQRWIRFRCAEFAYSGECNGPAMHGKGEWKAGVHSYIGWFEQGLRHGKGVYLNGRGLRWVGQWEHGKRQQGILYDDTDGGAAVRCAQWGNDDDSTPVGVVSISRPHEDKLWVGTSYVVMPCFGVEVCTRSGDAHFGMWKAPGRIRHGIGLALRGRQLRLHGTWTQDVLSGRGTLQVVGTVTMQGIFSDEQHITSGGAEITYHCAAAEEDIADKRWSSATLTLDEFASFWAALLPVRFETSDWHSFIKSKSCTYLEAEQAVLPSVYSVLWPQFVERSQEDQAMTMCQRYCKSSEKWRAPNGEPSAQGVLTIGSLDNLVTPSLKMDCIRQWVGETTSTAVEGSGADDLLPLLIHSLCVSSVHCPRAHHNFVEALREQEADWNADEVAYCWVLFSSALDWIEENAMMR